MTTAGLASFRPAAAQVPEPVNSDEDGSQDVSVGDTLTYVIKATNSGAVTLTNVVVSDALSGDTTTCLTLAPGGTCVLTVTYVVTAADVLAGQISTTATATSDQTGTVPLQEPAVIFVPRPQLSIAKPAPTNTDEDESGDVSEGDTLVYTVTATNTGTANLTNVVVSDASITRTGGTAPCALVPPGGTCTLIGTYVATAADAAAGQIGNVATADSAQTAPVQAAWSGRVAPRAPETAELVSIEIVSPEITTSGMVEAGADGVASVGDALTYRLTIANTGNVTLTSVAVNDAEGGINDCVIAALLPGESDDSSCAGSYVLTQPDIDAGVVENQASVTAEGPDGSRAADEATIRLEVPQEPSIAIERTGNLDVGADGIATPGDAISYSFRVQNTGNVTLTDVTVTDASAGVRQCAIGELAPGAVDSDSCTGSYVLTQANIDTGSVRGISVVTGVYSGGIITGVTDSGAASALSIPQNPALSVERTLTANADEDGSSDVSMDDSLTFEVTAVNTGNIMLTNVVVGDELTGDETTCPTLAPISACVLTEPYAVTQANVDSGQIPNLAYASSDQTGLVRPATAEPFNEVAAARVKVPSNFLTKTPGWSSISKDLDVIGTNVGLALLALITLLVATTVFNSTLEENAADIDAVVRRISGSPAVAPVFAALGWMSAEEAGGESRLMHFAKPAIIVALTALIYALLEPEFGLNEATLVVLAALIAGIALVTFLYEGGQVFWSSVHYATPAAMRVYPMAILIAIVCVALTRVTDMHPGIIFGFVTAAAIFPRGEMSQREKGLIIAVPLVSLMLAALVAFLLIDPLHDFSADNSNVWATLPETIAVALFVGGAESALLILIPTTFNDGEKIWSWNKLVWFALAIPAAFAFFHVVVNEEDYGELINDTNALTLVGMCIVVLIISGATWLFFKRRNPEGVA